MGSVFYAILGIQSRGTLVFPTKTLSISKTPKVNPTPRFVTINKSNVITSPKAKPTPNANNVSKNAIAGSPRARA